MVNSIKKNTMIVMGSLITALRLLITAFSTSFTSFVNREIKSPFRSVLK